MPVRLPLRQKTDIILDNGSRLLLKYGRFGAYLESENYKEDNIRKTIPKEIKTKIDNNTIKKEKNSTLEGTWKVKDFQDTIKQLSQVGANRVDVEKRIKNFYNDFDMTLTITNDNAVLHYTFDVTKLYEYYFKNFEKGIYEDLEQYTNKKRTSFNVNYNVLEHTKAIRDGNKIDYTLKNGEIDEDKKTITFPET